MIGASRWLALAIGAAFCASYVAIALLRIQYPFELEWMEGGVVDHVRRVVNGQPIFAPPSLDFVSYLYPPLYYYIAALPAAILGVDFLALRGLSLVASLGCGWAIFAIVARETGKRDLGFISASLYFATFVRSGGWFDLARVDSLFMFFLLSGIYLVGFAKTRRQLVMAGILLTSATLVKQSALVNVAPLVLCAAYFDFRRTLWWAGSLAGSLAISWIVLDVIHGGWLTYYCITLPRNHTVVYAQISDFWTVDLVGPLKIACGLSLLYLVLGKPPRRLAAWLGASSGNDPATADRRVASSEQTQRRWFYAAVAVGFIGASWSVRAMVGAWQNNLFPAFAAVAILTGLALHLLQGWIREAAAEGRPERGTLLEIGIWLAVVLQFGVLSYDPREQLPSDADRAAGEQLVEVLRSIDGEVFIPHHGYLAIAAGHSSYAHILAIDNVFLDDRDGYRERLRSELEDAIEARRFAALVVESDGRLHKEIRASYPPATLIHRDPNVFWPVSGGRLRPELLFVRSAGE